MKRLNIGVLAHVDAGKTTLVERVLFESQVIRQMGKIESGNTVMDSLDLERSRGVSIKNSYTSFMSHDVQINLIDTPGHYDFVDEVEHVLEILDGVILVISGIDGVQSQTKKFWRQLQAYGIPILLFINKTDYRFYDALAREEQLTKLLSKATLPLAMESEGFQLQENGVYTLIEGDDELEERFLEGQLSDQLQTALFLERFQQGRIYPVVSGSAKEGIGIEKLMALVRQIEPKKQADALAGFVYKVAYDKKLGRGCYIRLFGGQLRARDIVQFNRSGAVAHKISQLKQIVAGKIADASCGETGDIVIAYGLDGKVGDTLGDCEPSSLKKTPPLFLLSVKECQGKISELRQAVQELSEEYPALNYDWFEATGEIQLTMMGELQGDIIQAELRERYGLTITVSKPKIIYRETPSQSARGFEAYTMPKPSWAILKLLIEPAPRNSGYTFVNQADNDALLPRYHGQIANSLIEALKIGRMGWQVVDIKVTLLEGESHREHTHPLDFALATPIALQDGLAKADMILLEPAVLMKVTTTAEHLSKVTADIIGMEGIVLREEYQAQGYLEAVVPLATSLGYGAHFFKQTKGEGLLEQDFYQYQECPKSRYEYQERQGVDPLDRNKWILHRRGALS